MWIEQGFTVAKSGCGQWPHPRMTDPERAARLWAVLAVATLWLVEVGEEGEALPLPEVPPRPRVERLVKAGLRLLLLALLTGAALPAGRLRPQPAWPQREWQPDPLTEEMMDQS
jgi:hypothetical protein